MRASILERLDHSPWGSTESLCSLEITGAKLQGLDGRQEAVGPHQECLVRRQPVDRPVIEVEQTRMKPFQLRDERIPRLPEGIKVADGRPAAHRHHLGLEAVGQDVLHVVAEHVARLGGDESLGLHDMALGGVLLFDRTQLLGRCGPSEPWPA